MLFVVLGGLATSTRPKNGAFYTSVNEAVLAWIEGALAAIVWLMVIGSIGHLIARRRGIVRRWGESVLTFPILLLSLLLVFVAAGGRLAQRQAALDKATADSNGTLIQREKANLEAQSWSQTRAPVARAVRATIVESPKFVKKLTSEGNSAAVRQTAAEIERAFGHEAARWRTLPGTSLSDLQHVDAQDIDALSLASSGYADYLAALQANLASGLPMNRDRRALALLNRGDRRLRRAGAILQSTGHRVAALDAKYGAIATGHSGP